MFTFTDKGSITTCDGITRRDFLQAGTLGAIGLSLPQFNALARRGRGGQGQGRPRVHHDLQSRRAEPDRHLGPEAGRAARDSRAVQADQHQRGRHRRSREIFPRIAKLADKFSLVRSVYHTRRGGARHRPSDDADRPALHRRHQHAARRLRARLSQGPHAPSCPRIVILPEPMGPTGGNMPHGQDAGFLGKTYDPFVLNADPSSAKDFKVPDLLPPKEIGEVRLQRRRELRAARRRVGEELRGQRDGQADGRRISPPPTG